MLGLFQINLSALSIDALVGNKKQLFSYYNPPPRDNEESRTWVMKAFLFRKFDKSIPFPVFMSSSAEMWVCFNRGDNSIWMFQNDWLQRAGCLDKDVTPAVTHVTVNLFEGMQVPIAVSKFT